MLAAADHRDWPFHNYLELGALAGAVPCARLHARQLLWEWGISEVAEDVELLVSELVTNALHASLDMGDDLPVRLWLLSNDMHVVISVWDGNPRPPVRPDVADDAESGRGLVLVEALSDRWDWFAHQGLGGKVVWCELSREIMTAVPGRVPSTVPRGAARSAHRTMLLVRGDLAQDDDVLPRARGQHHRVGR